MYKIIYLPIARQDITEIVLYISGQLKAPQAAVQLLDAIDHSISLLAEFPYSHKLFHPIRPLDEEYRMLPVKNYVVFFVVREQPKIIEIQRILYSRMDISNLIK